MSFWVDNAMEKKKHMLAEIKKIETALKEKSGNNELCNTHT